MESAVETALRPPPSPAEWRAEVGGIEVVFGANAVDQLGVLAREVGGNRAFVVTDPGVAAAGHATRAAEALAREGIATCLYEKVSENPTAAEVAAGRDQAAFWQPDLFVAVGGGSAMDCAKGINLLLTNGGRMADYRGFGRATRPLLPALGVPTTAGTGSDAQSYALISDDETHEKMACGDRQARFRRVVLDPTVAISAPRRVIAATGLDALSHAVESHVCRKAHPVSRLFSREAWRLLVPAFTRVLSSPGRPDERAMADLLLGAHLAGAAIEASMLGAAHACANPLTARFGVVHGAAVALLLPAVVRFNAAHAANAVNTVNVADTAGTTDTEPLYLDLAGMPSARVAERIEGLRAAAGLPERLRDVGVGREDLPALARAAGGQWTATFNPRPVGAAELLYLYDQAY